LFTSLQRTLKYNDVPFTRQITLQSYIARTSILQTRLITTLDTIDLLQRRHSDELARFTADRDRMKKQLQRYTDVVKSAESERDDMRDAVFKLIEKGRGSFMSWYRRRFLILTESIV
jgi:hypothetical protein